MSESTETVEFVFDKLDGYMSAAQSVIDTYGGDAADLGLMALRIEAASDLIIPLIFTGLLIAILRYLLPIMIKGWKDEYDGRSNNEAATVVGTVGCGLAGFGLILSTIEVLDIWAWVGMFYPEAYAVHLFLLK